MSQTQSGEEASLTPCSSVQLAAPPRRASPPEGVRLVPGGPSSRPLGKHLAPTLALACAKPPGPPTPAGPRSSPPHPLTPHKPAALHCPLNQGPLPRPLALWFL